MSTKGGTEARRPCPSFSRVDCQTAAVWLLKRGCALCTISALHALHAGARKLLRYRTTDSRASQQNKTMGELTGL